MRLGSRGPSEEPSGVSDTSPKCMSAKAWEKAVQELARQVTCYTSIAQYIVYMFLHSIRILVEKALCLMRRSDFKSCKSLL